MAAIINFVRSQTAGGATQINWQPTEWGIEIGDMVGLLFAKRSDSDPSGPRFPEQPGWTEVYDDGGTTGGALLYRVWQGNEGVQLVLNDPLGQGRLHIFVVKKGTFADPAVLPPKAIFKIISPSVTTWTLSSTVPEEILTPGGGAQDFAWIAVAHTNTAGGTVVSYPPDFEGNRLHEASSGGGAACGLGRCTRELNAESLSDVTFEMNTAISGVLALIAIAPAPAPTFKPWFAQSSEVIQ